MHCNTCGQQLDPAAKFCGRCGAARSNIIVSRPSPGYVPSVHIPKEEKPRRAAAILVPVCCVLLAVIAFAMLQPFAVLLALLALFAVAVWGSTKAIKWPYKVGFALAVAILIFFANAYEVQKRNGLTTRSEQESQHPVYEAASRDAVPAKALLDLNVLALHSRTAVENVIGKPLSFAKRTGQDEIGDTATYSWGKVVYAGNHLVAIQRMNPPHPYSAALAEFGLPKDSEPYVREGDGTLIWNNRPFNSGIQSSQGLVIDSAFLPADFSEFHIWILDGYHPKSWTDDECVMWLQMSGAKIPEAAMQRGNAIYWPLNHDDTPQVCNSGGSTKY
jgi:hypothetical protein